jgi:hypothetical protein
MGYALAFSPCLSCRLPFAYNPVWVPSLRVNGSKEPICQRCFQKLNTLRRERGLDPWPEPHPEAYSACEESELW